YGLGECAWACQVTMGYACRMNPSDGAISALSAALPETPLIASGEIRDGVDVAKAIRLGANLVGQAAAVLPSAMDSTAAVVEHFEVVIQQLRIACFCTGSADLDALRRAPMTRDGVPLEPPP